MQIKPEYLEKSKLRGRKRRLDPEKKNHDYRTNAKWRDKNRDKIIKMGASARKRLVPYYVAQSMRISVKDLTPDVIETKRLIIELKRELRSKHIKIR